MVRYDLRTRRLTPTRARTVNLSPDGRFYLMRAEQASDAGLCQPSASDACIRVFETSSARVVELPTTLRTARALHWLGDDTHALLLQQGTRKARDTATSLVFDAARVEITNRVPGRSVPKRTQNGWVTSGRGIVLRSPAIEGLREGATVRATELRRIKLRAPTTPSPTPRPAPTVTPPPR